MLQMECLNIGTEQGINDVNVFEQEYLEMINSLGNDLWKGDGK